MDRITDTETPTPHVNTDTSREAANWVDVSGRKNALRSLIHDKIKQTDGSTCEEIERSMTIRHQSASSIIRGLTKDGFLYDSGERRMNTSGRKAIVWKTKNPNRKVQTQMKLF